MLEPGGVLAFCDFLQPTADVREQVRPQIYDRMMRNGYLLVEYQVTPQQAGRDHAGPQPRPELPAARVAAITPGRHPA